MLKVHDLAQLDLKLRSSFHLLPFASIEVSPKFLLSSHLDLELHPVEGQLCVTILSTLWSCPLVAWLSLLPCPTLNFYSLPAISSSSCTSARVLAALISSQHTFAPFLWSGWSQSWAFTCTFLFQPHPTLRLECRWWFQVIRLSKVTFTDT